MKIGIKSKQSYATMTEEKKQARLLKMMKSKELNGTLHTMGRANASWKAGWREVGGQRCYFRSRWEANYGRLLQFLMERGEIAKWEHEPETFWFEGIKRGAVSYLPDFRVTHHNGKVEYHEVKGWMDDRSKTKIKRMEKYHPETTLIVIDSAAYKRLQKQVAGIVPEWEAA